MRIAGLICIACGGCSAIIGAAYALGMPLIVVTPWSVDQTGQWGAQLLPGLALWLAGLLAATTGRRT